MRLIDFLQVEVANQSLVMNFLLSPQVRERFTIPFKPRDEVSQCWSFCVSYIIKSPVVNEVIALALNANCLCWQSTTRIFYLL